MYWLIFLRPTSPSFFRASRFGLTAVISCMMMAAEIYGMMFSAKIDMRPSAPPANMSNMPRMPPAFWRKISSSATGSIPGSGI